MAQNTHLHLILLFEKNGILFSYKIQEIIAYVGIPTGYLSIYLISKGGSLRKNSGTTIQSFWKRLDFCIISSIKYEKKQSLCRCSNPPFVALESFYPTQWTKQIVKKYGINRSLNTRAVAMESFFPAFWAI